MEDLEFLSRYIKIYVYVKIQDYSSLPKNGKYIEEFIFIQCYNLLEFITKLQEATSLYKIYFQHEKIQQSASAAHVCNLSSSPFCCIFVGQIML